MLAASNSLPCITASIANAPPMQKPMTPTRFAPRSRKKARGAGGVLRGGVGEVEPLHQMVRFVAGCRGAAAIQIRHDDVEAVRRQAIGRRFDAIVEPPPLLEQHDAGRVALWRRSEVPGRRLSVGPRNSIIEPI